jgi:xanthine/CO dehydrogenase XdhC/CoxF family maturation factor
MRFLTLASAVVCERGERSANGDSTLVVSSGTIWGDRTWASVLIKAVAVGGANTNVVIAGSCLPSETPLHPGVVVCCVGEVSALPWAVIDADVYDGDTD